MPADLAGDHYVADLQGIRERPGHADIDNRPRTALTKPPTQSALGVARPFAGFE